MNTLPETEVMQLWSDYRAGKSMAQIGRERKRNAASMSRIFRRRGYQLRAFRGPARRDPKTARFLPKAHATPEEITAALEKLKRLMIPPELALEWRMWPWEKRAEMVRRMRERFPSNLPAGALSPNVERFDYTSPRAWELMKKANRGLDSRSWKLKIKVASEGVIWKGKLFFWSKKAGYELGPFVPGRGRALLHHVIWEEANGRPVPAHFTVIHRDGNRNNLRPANLGLRHRRDCAAENMGRWRVKISRERTGALLGNFQRKASDERHDYTKAVRFLEERRPGRKAAQLR